MTKYFRRQSDIKTVIPRNIKLWRHQVGGMPISVYDARSKGAKSYDKFVKEF